MPNSAADLENILRLKTEMLCNGVSFSTKFLDELKRQNRTIPGIREGGAGPAGGMYFKFENESIVNSLVFIGKTPDINITINSIDSRNRLEYQYNYNNKISPTPLFLIENPKFYSEKNDEGIEFRKIALMHGDKVMATTINQKCNYWRTGNQCQFCAIELSLNAGNTIEKKNANEIIEWINIARKENPNCSSHITLTSGTTPSPDKGIIEYIPVIQKMKKAYPDIPIHIQIEPMKDKKWYDKVHDAGADTIGIHLEILDDDIRETICPGKASLSKNLYQEHWRYAINIFGKNQVSSFILLGFEENFVKVRAELEEIIKIGVIPIITPMRSIPSLKRKLAKITASNFYDITQYAAEKMLEYGVNPLKNKAGCVKCEGCSSIVDAYRVVQNKFLKA